jgi:hypothetical protein
MRQIVLLSASLLLGARAPVAAPHPNPLAAAQLPSQETGLRIVAESERTLSRVVLGLNPNETRYFLLPETAASGRGANNPHLAYLRQQLYWLNFELERGRLFRHAPPRIRFFLAVPDARTTAGSLGGEENLFHQYLRERAGWSEDQIRDRIRFFHVREPIPYPQDMAEAVGYDDRGRLVLAMGLDCSDRYREPVERLVEQFPDEFVLRRLAGLNTEGGDLALVRLPDARLGLLVGRGRIGRYLEDRYGLPLEGKPIEPPQIEEARRAYRDAFFGLEVIIVGEDALREPRLGNPELFHLDMVASVFRGRLGVVAFVPTYVGTATDALSHVPLPLDLVSRIQGEYDRVARQLEARGYRVARLPFADHPVRNPVGAAKFVDPTAQRSFVMLGRYPYHFELPDGQNPQRLLRLAFQKLDTAVAAWRRSPTATAWTGVESALRTVWEEMDRAAASPNPIFDKQKAIYEANGIEVVPVPIFPTGEGGIHCIVLK